MSSHVSKIECLRNGYTWTGFDASGHCFLLSWNNLFMVEEFLICCQGLFCQDPPDTQHSQVHDKESKPKIEQPGKL